MHVIAKRLWFWVLPVAVTIALTVSREALAQRQITVNIDSIPQGATVRLDSETAPPLGTTPLRRVRIPAGAHTLYFSREGFLPGRLDVTVARRNETFTATLTQAGSIYVSADIDGAQIFLDGNAVGTTPGRINNVPPGQHVIEIRQQGMQPYRETVTVGAGAVASVNATLRPPPPQTPPTGTVRVIVSNPAGPLPTDLQVTFDGTPITGTPPTVENAQPGQHIVQVSATGFRTVRRTVEVTAGQTVALAVDLEPAQVTPTGGTVRVLVNTPNAQVELDGEVLSGTPPSRTNVSPGTHVLRVTAPGRQPYVNNSVTVVAGQDTVINVPDLAVLPQVGRMAISTPTPEAHVIIDGQDRGPAPYTRDDMPYGEYNVTVRAPGYDDRTERCRVSATEQCVLNIPLTRTVPRASVHVELTRPVPGAIVVMDGNELGEVGAGRDIPNLAAGPEHPHELRIQAPGFQDYIENFVLQPGEARRLTVTLRRERRGPTGAELAQRRAAISTWGASPLARGDTAMDVVLGYGSYPVEVRGMTGLVAYGLVGLDAGFSVRTSLWMWEFEVRSRAGFRFADGLFSLGAELRPFAGLGVAGQNTFGLGGSLIASLHSLAPTSDTAEEEAEERERINRPGSFAFSLRLGFEASSDNLSGSVQSPGFLGASRRFDEALCRYNNGPCQYRMEGNDRIVSRGGQGLVRLLAGAMIEIGLGRNWNLFGGVEAVVADRSVSRALYQAIWFGHDSVTYIRLGTTYKF